MTASAAAKVNMPIVASVSGGCTGCPGSPCTAGFGRRDAREVALAIRHWRGRHTISYRPISADDRGPAHGHAKAEYFSAAPRRSSAERQSGALLGLGAWPEDAARALVDPHIVDAGLTATHVALAVELPLLVAVASPPLAGGVTTLVVEAHGDPVVRERPQVLAQRIVDLALPLAAQELDDLGPTRRPLLAVAPPRVLGVGRGHSLGVASVPRILCRLNLLARGRFGERGYWRSHRFPRGRSSHRAERGEHGSYRGSGGPSAPASRGCRSEQLFS